MECLAIHPSTPCTLSMLGSTRIYIANGELNVFAVKFAALDARGFRMVSTFRRIRSTLITNFIIHELLPLASCLLKGHIV